ncbi:MAG: prepilin-type N-terminal cleavage/methylation domain-containing protein [Dictyoglomus sp.]|nr:prepilin-type N-terminal cleavage/methylation domain-containing protein [Dictyoglomus sp.]MCX7941804.1 prepilin-type N-terminal cleavage/methylation domain-containing protein [Dictyoglomaceae bacterium]MDW8188093.1 prepilin-type N-terminal cleavage/methylation domain-containing protein [Dictyoglomus sp.]
MMKRGFTLVEFLISVTVSFIVITAIVNFLIVGSRSYQSLNQRIDLQRNARLVSDRLIREIKRASSIDPSSDGSSIIINYYIYTLQTNIVSSSLSTVRYYVNPSGILRRQVKQGSLWVGDNPLTENNFRVLTPVFYYLDASSNITSPNLAKIVLVDLKLDADRDNRADYTLSFSIYLPLKENYFLR